MNLCKSEFSFIQRMGHFCLIRKECLVQENVRFGELSEIIYTYMYGSTLDLNIYDK